MSILVLAYPEIEAGGFDLIQEFRSHHDQLYFKVVDPHFTLLFPVFDFSAEQVLEEVKRVAKGSEKFSFSKLKAISHKDELSELSYVFLVPEIGYGNIVNLHDALYGKILAAELKKEIPYIPHVSIASSQEQERCIELATDWNNRKIEIEGIIGSMSVVNYENNTVEILHTVNLL
jgi:hypothetical protein